MTRANICRASRSPQRCLPTLLLLLTIAIMILSVPTCSGATMTYLKYVTDASSSSQMWNGDCNMICSVIDPCEYDGLTTINMSYAPDCAYVLSSTSAPNPLFSAETSSFPVGSSINFLVENGFPSWNNFTIFQYGANITFTSSDLASRSTLGGNVMIVLDVYFAANYSAQNLQSLGVAFSNLNLIDPIIIYKSTSYLESLTSEFTSAMLGMGVYDCNISSSSTASAPWFSLDTSASYVASGGMLPFVATALQVTRSHLAMNFEETETAIQIVPFASSLFQQLPIIIINFDSCFISGKAKSLTRNADPLTTQSMIILFASSTVYEAHLDTLFEDTGPGSFFLQVQTGSILSFVPLASNPSKLTNATLNPTCDFSLSHRDASISGLHFPDTSYIGIANATFTNCNFEPTDLSILFPATATIQFNASLSPTQYTGPYYASFVGSAMTHFLNSALALLKRGHPNATFIFSGTYDTKMFNNIPTASSLYMDSAMSLAAGTIVTTATNMTLTGGIMSADLGAPSSLSVSALTVRTPTSPSLKLGRTFTNTMLNLSGFASLTIDASNPASSPLLSPLGSGSISGYPYRGLIVDWGMFGGAPRHGVVYNAFITNMTSETSNFSTPFTATSIVDSSTSQYPMTIEVSSFVLEDAWVMWNVTLYLDASYPLAPIEPIAEPTAAPIPSLSDEESPSTPSNPPTTSPTSVTSCPPPPPGFICSGGKWVSNGTVNQPTTTFTVTTSSVVVNGNFTVESVVFTGTHQTVTVLGCITLNNNGTVSVDLSDEDPNTLSGKTVSFLTQQGFNCSTSLSTVPVSITQPKHTCANVKSKSAPTSSHDTLALLFSVDRSSCNTKWIVLGSVLGILAIIAVVVISIVYVFLKKKQYSESHKTLTNQK